MRALVRDAYGGPDVLRVEDVVDPVPHAGEVVVRVRASSLNMADVDLLRGRPLAARPYYGVSGPKNRFIGVDLVGEIAEVGAGVAGWAPGDRVWADVIDGGHSALAELARVPASVLRRAPRDVSSADAATVPHSGLLALQLVRSIGGVRPGERVLVNGGGGCVGPFAIQLATAAGARVTGVDTAAKAELMRAAGADDTIDFRAEDVTRSGRRFDVVIDIADVRGLVAMRRLLTRGGRYTMVARRIGSYVAKLVFAPAFGALTGARMKTLLWRANDPEMLEEFGRLVASGTIRPIVDSTVTLDDLPSAFSRLVAGENRGKIVVEP